MSPLTGLEADPKRTLYKHVVPGGTVQTVSQPDQGQPGAPSENQTGRRHAVVIGVSQYSELATVPHASANARTFRDALLRSDSGLEEKNVRVLLDYEAGLSRIRDELEALARPPLDVVYLYFAGLGVGNQTEGYLLPYDVILDQPASQSLSVVELRSKLQRVSARHIILIVDAAYHDAAGRALKLSGGSDNQIGERLKDQLREARRVSLIPVPALGEASEADRGKACRAFTEALVRGWQGQADLNGDGKILSSELSQYMRERVATETISQRRIESTPPDQTSAAPRESLPQQPTQAETPREDQRSNAPGEQHPTASEPASPPASVGTVSPTPANPPADSPSPQPIRGGMSTESRANTRPCPRSGTPSAPPPLADLTAEKSVSRVEAETLRAEADAILVRYLSDNPPTESEWRKAGEHYVKVAGAWAEEKNQWLSRARFCLAQAALVRDDHDGAAAHLEEAVRLQPRHEETRFALAETYVELACYELAARQFEFLIRDLGQDEFDAHIGLAIASEHLGRGEQAEPEYRRAIQLSPEQPTGYYYLGLFYYGAKRYAEAIQQYDEALKRNPKNRAEVYYSRGLAHQLRGSVQPAMEDYQHATVLNATWLEPRRALAQVFESSEVRRYQDAIAVYQTILELNRKDPFAHWRLGYCYEQSGDAPAAIRAYEQALELDPEGAAGFKPDTLRQHIQELKTNSQPNGGGGFS